MFKKQTTNRISSRTRSGVRFRNKTARTYFKDYESLKKYHKSVFSDEPKIKEDPRVSINRVSNFKFLILKFV